MSHVIWGIYLLDVKSSLVFHLALRGSGYISSDPISPRQFFLVKLCLRLEYYRPNVQLVTFDVQAVWLIVFLCIGPGKQKVG